ncbi:hypothetical protein TIFTF001_006169 [Ficus carica]|uniref:Uncharacterized protein n=1 Tax=Ficus carica TaxID=3494 RepID=A0AA87ZMC4_FICCA|nr:hypothetical protein TIFTF001_006169 [Ficus carica]
MEGSSFMMRSVPRSTNCGPRFFVVSVALFFGFLLALFFVVELLRFGRMDEVGVKGLMFSKETRTGLIGRKLLQSADDGGAKVNHIGTGTCSTEDISIFQGQTAPLPNGIPSYTVQILNACASGCGISNIHVKCGWFSSVRLVSPRVFRRLYYDDCLVNDGEPLAPGETLSFQYANSFQYPLSVSSVACCSN